MRCRFGKEVLARTVELLQNDLQVIGDRGIRKRKAREWI